MPSPFIWHELLTSDAAAARTFYHQLLGWELAGEGFAVDGLRVAGVRNSKIVPHWAPFVRVADPEACARAVASAGGRVAGRPESPPGIVLLDPRGVPTVASAAEGRDLFVWHILESTDVSASGAWLAATVGLTVPARGGLWRGEEQVGSLVSGTHDQWLCHVLVADRHAVRERALGLGARVEAADVEASGFGSFDTLLDPQGAAFCVFQAAG